jgi:glycosyltransferase involved in cell wall biosynthesis
MALLPKRVLIVANSRSTISDSFVAAFERSGILATLFDLEAANCWFDRSIIHQSNKIAHNLRLIPKSRVLFYDHAWSHRVYRARKMLERWQEFRPDLVLHLRSWSILPEVLREIRSGSALFGWWIEGDHRLDEVLPFVPEYDRFYFFTTAGVRKANEVGFKNVAHLPHAIDTSRYHPLPDLPKIYDWVFVGKWTEHRQNIVSLLSHHWDRYAIYGPHWRSRNWNNLNMLLHIKGRSTTHEELLRLYSSTKVVLNITQWGSDTERRIGMNYRVLEAMACQTCLVTDLSEDSLLYFEPGLHFVVFSNTDELVERVKGLLRDKAARSAVARQGHERVASRFSFDSRVRTMIEDYSGIHERKHKGFTS